jgi:hypothetical protein
LIESQLRDIHDVWRIRTRATEMQQVHAMEEP